MLATCRCTVCTLRNSRPAIWASPSPPATRRRTSASRRLSSSDAVRPARPARTEQRERLAREACFRFGPFGSPECLQRLRQQHPRLGDLVGRRAGAEQVGGVLRGPPGGVVVAARQQHLRAHQTPATAHVRRREPRRLALHLLGSRSRAGPIPGSCPSSREQLQRRQPIQHARVSQPPQRAIRRVRGRRRIAAGQVQLAERGDRRGQWQRRLEQPAGLGEVALPATQPSQPHGGGRRQRGPSGTQVGHRTLQLLLSGRPIPAGGEHLAIGGAANPEEVPGVPGRRPAVQGAAPLLGAPEVADLGAGRDRVAQRPTRRGRLDELLANRQRRRLVQPSQALLDRSRRHQRAAEDRERDHLNPDIRDAARDVERRTRQSSQP